MKNIISILIFCLICVYTNQVFAGYNAAKILYMQGDSTGRVIYVFLDRDVPSDDCDVQYGEDSNRLILRQPDYDEVNNFDQIYSILLLAQANDKEIQVLSSKGQCYGGTANNRYIDGPYIRY